MANICYTASNCRVDADCGPGGFCSPSNLDTIIQCWGPCGTGYFCHTPKDSCLDGNDCNGSSGCYLDPTSQSWMCMMLRPPPA